MKSWKTTVTGIFQFLTIAGTQLLTMIDNDPGTNPEWNIIIASLITMVGLFTARDNDVSSESAGAR